MARSMAALPAEVWQERVGPGSHALKDGAEFKASKSTSAGNAPFLKTPVQQQRLCVYQLAPCSREGGGGGGRGGG